MCFFLWLFLLVETRFGFCEGTLLPGAIHCERALKRLVWAELLQFPFCVGHGPQKQPAHGCGNVFIAQVQKQRLLSDIPDGAFPLAIVDCPCKADGAYSEKWVYFHSLSKSKARRDVRQGFRVEGCSHP